MRFQYFCIPAIVAAAPVHADDFLTLQQAQALIFPGAEFTPQDFVLSDEQIAQLIKETQAPIWRRQVKVWRASTGGWFFLDQVIGRDDRITYAVGLDGSGAVKGVEILTCLQKYDGIRRPDWLAQFVGKHYSPSDLLNQIATISGSTLSTTHITEGVKRVLATYALFMPGKTS
jgi:FMN-binding domain